MGKFLFYDTCSLLSELKNAFRQEEKFFISSVTLNELEGIKTSGTKDEETKYNSRKLLHLLEENEEKYEIVLYDSNWDSIIKEKGLPLTNDSKIIISAFIHFGATCGIENGVFVTKDLACKAIAKAVKLNTRMIKYGIEADEYNGFMEVKLNDVELANFYSITLQENQNPYNLLINQYLILRNELDFIIDKYKWTSEGYKKINFIKAESKMFGKVVPKDGDIYQQLALDSLVSNQISMIEGPAGTGKSYLSFGVMFDMLEHGKIDKIIVFCNTVATKGSAKLGFYPGSRDEKLLDSQIGNLLTSKIGDRIQVEKMVEDGSIVLLPMSDIRGYDTTGMHAAVYISEAQNLDIELMRLALQRIGSDSICIIDGDSNAQVDSALYAGSNNGMKRVSEIFRGSDIFGEVKLQTIKRSKIAELAQLL